MSLATSPAFLREPSATGDYREDAPAPLFHRRSFLRGLGLFGAAIRIPLPPLACMFTANGTTYAADATTGLAEQAPPTRFVNWFNGNGIPERYWIPLETGADYTMTPCLSPLARFRDDIHVVSGLDNPNARTSGVGNAHQRSMSALVSGEKFTGRGAGGASIDQSNRREDRRRVAFPLVADRRLPGIVRHQHPAQHELGGEEPSAAAGDHSAPAV